MIPSLSRSPSSILIQYHNDANIYDYYVCVCVYQSDFVLNEYYSYQTRVHMFIPVRMI